MSQINRVPRGLQDFLGSQNFGDNPSELGSVVAPVLDITDYLKSERRFFNYNASAGVAVDGAVLSHTVPSGELWYIEGVSVGVGFAGVGGSWTAEFGYMHVNPLNSNQPTVPHPVISVGRVAPNAGAIISSGFTILSAELPKWYPLFSGESLQLQINNGSYAGGQLYTVRSALRYIKALA